MAFLPISFLYIIQFEEKNVNSFAKQNQLIELIEKTGILRRLSPENNRLSKNA